MSVLNQMLRDLEKRGATQALATVGSAAVRAQAATPARGGSRIKRMLAVVLAGAALLLGTHAWLDRGKDTALLARRPLGSSQFGPAQLAGVAGTAGGGMIAASVAPIPPATGAPGGAVSGEPTLQGTAASGDSIGAASAAPAMTVAPGGSASASTAVPAPAPTVAPGGSANVATAMPTPATTVAPSGGLAAAAIALRPPLADTAVLALVAPSGSAPAFGPAPKENGRASDPPSRRVAPRGVGVPALRDSPKEGTAAAATVQLTQASPRDPQRAEIDRAADLIAHGRSAEAVGLLRQVLAKNPPHLLARRTLVALLAEAGQRDQAQAALLDGAAVDPTSFALAAAQMQAAAGDTQGALRTLDLVPVATRSANHLALTGGLAQRLGQHAAAVTAYKDALRRPNPEPVWWLGLAISLEALGQDADARVAYQQAAAQPGLPDAVRQFVAQKIAAAARMPRSPAAEIAATGN